MSRDTELQELTPEVLARMQEATGAPALSKPHLWKLRGTWYCAGIYRRPATSGKPRLVPDRCTDRTPAVMPDEPIGTGATPGEAGTVWRLVKHGRRYQTALQGAA